jgi:anti-sigma B factor antagonist
MNSAPTELEPLMNFSRCTILRAADTAIVTLVGDLDAPEIDAVAFDVERLCSRPPSRVVLDLGAVSFIGSRGLSMLLAVRDAVTAAGGEVVVTEVSRPAQRLFEITATDHLFAVAEAAHSVSESGSSVR